MWWERRRAPAEQQLISSLEDQVGFLRSELDSRARETERLHGLLAQKEQNTQVLMQTVEALPSGSPTERRADTYLSQLLPVAFLAVVGGPAIASFFTVEDSTVQWTITGLNIAAIVSLVTMNWLSKRVAAIDEDSRKNNPAIAQRYMRSAMISVSLYILGVILFVVSTVLLAVN